MVNTYLASGIAILIGLVSIVMAQKALFLKRLLPFYEKILDRSWDNQDSEIKLLMLGQMRFIGVIFIAVVFSIAGFVVSLFFKDLLAELISIFLTVVLNIGLILGNYNIYKKTKAQTPWKESIIALVVFFLSIVVSIFSF